MTGSVLVRGRWIFAGADQPPVADGAVAVTGDRIAEVGAFADLRPRYPDAAVIGSPGAAVLPGFINAHHHGQALTSIQCGMGEDILETWLPGWAATRPRDRYLDTLLSGANLLMSGVTRTVDVWSDGAQAATFADQVRESRRGYGDSGIRVSFAAGLADQSFLVWGAGEDERFIASLPEDLQAAARGLLPTGNLTEDEYFDAMADLGRESADDPRFDLWYEFPGPQWASDGFIQRIAERAEAADTNIQTHANESIYEKLHGPRFYGADTMVHLERLGVLSPRLSIAHGCWLSEAEIEAMARTGAAVSHDPGSNLRLYAGIAPVNALRAAGVTVGLGMDATTLNDDEDMFAEMRLALRLHREPVYGATSMTPADVFGLATLGGAKLLRREQEFGRLAPGYAADLVVVDLDRATWPWVAPECDPLSLVILRAARRDVDTVMVGGEVVVRDGKPTRFDLAEAAQEFADRMAALPYPADIAATLGRIIPHMRSWYESWEVPPTDPYIAYNSRR